MNTRLSTLTALLLAPLAALPAAEHKGASPNILLIITDQQHAGMLSCAGNRYLQTPNLDNLARTGTRFERAYCGNPVCVPSRFCMLSGTMPSRIGMESNGEIGNEVPQEIFDHAMGTVFRCAGYVRQQWAERDWRLHRWAYARLTERVDGEIGKVLAAMRESGLEDNTLVIFTSDHGDMDSAHRFEHKSLLYEEAVRVPLLVSWKGVTPASAVDRDHLVSTGLDLLPTMCDFAGVPVPAALKGRSVKPLMQGRPVESWRSHLVVENHQARLVLADRWKYMVGAGGEIREMLVDLERDPGELQNFASDPAYRQRLETGRRLLKQWYASHGLTLDAEYLVERESGDR